MTYREATEMVQALRSGSEANDADWNELYDDFLKSAVQYAQVRADWTFMDVSQRNEADRARTATHDSVIDRLNILLRYAYKKYNQLPFNISGMDRKEIGDFACYIHCLLGIEAR